jgi:hypothetical protein
MPTGWIPPERRHPRAAQPPSTAASSRRRERRPVPVVLQVDCTGVYVAPVTLRRRIEALLLADRLDHALATGAVPETDVLLALRAERLACARTRAELADSIGRLLRAAAEPQRGLTRAPTMAVLERVRESHDALEELVDHLLAPVPVSAHGVALVRLLLRDGGGPLFRYESRADLTSQVRRAIAALDPGQDWPD